MKKFIIKIVINSCFIFLLALLIFNCNKLIKTGHIFLQNIKIYETKKDILYDKELKKKNLEEELSKTIQINKGYKEKISSIINTSSNSKRKFFEAITVSSPTIVSKYEKQSIDTFVNIPDEIIFYVFEKKPFVFYSLEKNEIPSENSSMFNIDYETIIDSYQSTSKSKDLAGMYNTSRLSPGYSNILLLTYALINNDETISNIESTILHEFAHAIYFSESKNSKIPLDLSDKTSFRVTLSKKYSYNQVITNYIVVDYYLTNKEECFAELFSWKYSKNDVSKKIYNTYKKKYPNENNYEEIDKFINNIKKKYVRENYNYGELYVQMLEKKADEEVKIEG